MKSNMTRVLLGLVTALALSACGVGPSADELIVGDWVQTKSIEVDDTGVSLEISDSSIRYLSDGTSQSSARLKIGNVPAALSTYQVEAVGTWAITKSNLIETITQADVINTSGNPQAAAIAQQMADTILAAEPSSAEILTLTQTQLTLRETEANYTIQFEKR
jgi:hypothetical protein